MSFILEALKKQEAGRNPDAAVSLARQTVERRRSGLWVTLFGIAVAANAGLLIWTFGLPWLPSSERARTMPVPESAESTRGAAVPASEASPPPAAPAATPPRADDGPTATAVSEPPPRVREVALQNLSADARARFPGIAFSTHIYAEDADLRAIVANGQRLQEGDRIRGLEIVAITEAGVVLAFENYRVAVPIVTDW